MGILLLLLYYILELYTIVVLNIIAGREKKNILKHSYETCLGTR
jgi:hypothetical protein